MKNNVSTQYAEALFILSCEEKIEEKCLNDLQLVRSVMDTEPDYLVFLNSPSVKKEEKLEAINSAFCERVHEYIVSFLMLLCENGRIELLNSCIDEYEKLYNELRNVDKVQIISAVKLTEDEKSRITEGLERKLGHRVELICEIDEGIMGGIIIKTSDAIIDGSLKRKMREVKEVISGESKT